MDQQFRSKQYQRMVVIKIYVQHLGFHDTSLSIKCEQNDKKTFENPENYTFSEVFRISGDSQFCWLDMYGGNTYWPIFWREKSEESKDE